MRRFIQGWCGVMAVIPFDFNKKRELEAAEIAFASIHGFLIPENQPGWADDVFIPGNACYESYLEAQGICLRLQERLGTIGEDPDLVALTDHMAAYGKQLALEMFFCGIRYQKAIE